MRQDLDKAALSDLENDAIKAEHQAQHGPFYPERGINRESLLAYAESCRAQMARYRDGGAHNALLRKVHD